MQLSAHTVNWNKLEHLRFNGSVYDAVWNSDQHLFLGAPPWPSDSCIQFSELSECYEAIRATVPAETRAHADKIINKLINKSFEFPWDLANFERTGHVIGAISPVTVRELLQEFSRVSYAELDEAFNFRMPPETRKSCEIANYPSEDVFTGYLRQWENLLKYAVRREAGVLLHCG
ncbi:MAG: hypothetical protein WD851_10535 [Pirellulales bacterium]